MHGNGVVAHFDNSFYNTCKKSLSILCMKINHFALAFFLSLEWLNCCLFNCWLYLATILMLYEWHAMLSYLVLWSLVYGSLLIISSCRLQWAILKYSACVALRLICSANWCGQVFSVTLKHLAFIIYALGASLLSSINFAFIYCFHRRIWNPLDFKNTARDWRVPLCCSSPYEC